LPGDGMELFARSLLSCGWAAGLLAVTIAVAAPTSPAGTTDSLPRAKSRIATQNMSDDVRRILRWVKSTRDNGDAPFILIDKRRTHLWLFDPAGELIGQTAVLLGLAKGDVSVPGIGEREIAKIRPHERTTPAGRFILEAGYNARGEDIFWVDYDAAVSMHRVRAPNHAERRLQRLASSTPADNRISYGCINVPSAFYDTYLRTLFWARPGVAYLLPDTLALDKVFNMPVNNMPASP